MWMKNKFCSRKLLRFVCSFVTAENLTDVQDNQIFVEIDNLSLVNLKNIYLASVL